jgi:hypothetical protein
MAMLMLNNIFERTWGARAGNKPDNDYWKTLIPAIKAKWPEFRFIAEAYWDLEWELQQQGFDFCYDKKLYDRMEHGPAEDVRLHLCADRAYQEGMVRFISDSCHVSGWKSPCRGSGNSHDHRGKTAP